MRELDCSVIPNEEDRKDTQGIYYDSDKIFDGKFDENPTLSSFIDRSKDEFIGFTVGDNLWISDLGSLDTIMKNIGYRREYKFRNVDELCTSILYSSKKNPYKSKILDVVSVQMTYSLPKSGFQEHKEKIVIDGYLRVKSVEVFTDNFRSSYSEFMLPVDVFSEVDLMKGNKFIEFSRKATEIMKVREKISSNLYG